MLEMTTGFGERDNGRATGGDRADLVEKTGNPVLGRLFSLGKGTNPIPVTLGKSFIQLPWSHLYMVIRIPVLLTSYLGKGVKQLA